MGRNERKEKEKEIKRKQKKWKFGGGEKRRGKVEHILKMPKDSDEGTNKKINKGKKEEWKILRRTFF